MLKRLTTSLGREYKYLFRNRMVLFGLFGPLLMVFILQLILPAATSFELELAVREELPAAVRDELAGLAELVVAADVDELHAITARFSDTPGVVLRDGRLTLLLQGNEADNVVEAAGRAVAVAQAVLDGRPPPQPDITVVVDEDNALARWRGIFARTFALFGITVGSLAVGFSLMEERLCGVTAALSVSPLRRGEYLLGKTLAAGLLSLVLPPLIYLLLGVGADWGALLLVSVVGVTVGAGIGMLLGLYADSEMQLMTYFKALAVIIFPPIVAALVPAAWHPTMWWLPTYWLGRGYAAAAAADWSALLLPLGVALALGLGLLLFAAARLRHRLETG
ncbi:MAG: hypothetical protein GF399_02855 [Candidatus Coatesbacteria bacterium]|nr:hypothetical protein [Candidatus Coatesbacteria bacterium]